MATVLGDSARSASTVLEPLPGKVEAESAAKHLAAQKARGSPGKVEADQRQNQEYKRAAKHLAAQKAREAAEMKAHKAQKANADTNQLEEDVVSVKEGPEKTVVVVEFGGSGCKVVVYSGDEYLEPEGTIKVPGFSKESPFGLSPEENAGNIKQVITDSGMDGKPIVFFVSGGHIAKSPRVNPLCDPNLDSYIAKNCVPIAVETTRLKLMKLMKRKEIIAIETDEAKAEAMSVMAGFGYVTGALPIYPVLILLGGSTSSQLVYISSAAATPVSSTFIMQDSQENPYKALVEQKLMGIVNGGGGSPETVFFCSNFAFALVRPALTSDDTFSNTYFRDDPKAKAGVTKTYKPNQAAALTFKDVAYSLQDQFPAYDRDPKVWATLRILHNAMAGYFTYSPADPPLTFHVFKELTKSGNIVKVGSSHGVAMQLMN